MARSKTTNKVCLVLALWPLCAAMADTAYEYQATQAYIADASLPAQANSAVSSSQSLLPDAPSNASELRYYDRPNQMAGNAAKDMESPEMVGSLVRKHYLPPKSAAEILDQISPQIKSSKETQESAGAIEDQQGIYCSDGTCQQTDTAKNEDFGTSITELNAVNEEASEVQRQGGRSDPYSIRIFSGRTAHCRDITLGIRNCCADRGWASGIIHCRGEEKDLGHAKEKGGLVVYVGRYCAHKILGHCTEHKKGYCIFSSRIAYDIQIFARRELLRIGFGSPEHPNCSGLNPEDISRIHLDQIDFSNVVSQSISKSTIPGNSGLSKHIEREVNQRTQGGVADE